MRAEFPDIGSLIRWLNDIVTETKYDLYYVGREDQVIAVKNVSTEPLIHGVVRDVTENDVMSLRDQTECEFITIVGLEWDHDHTDPYRGDE